MAKDFRSHYIFCSAIGLDAIKTPMNNHSVAKRRPTKSGRSTVLRKPPPRKAAPGQSGRKLGQSNGHHAPLTVAQATTSYMNLAKVNVSPVTAIGAALRAHKFRVGETVLYTSSPIARPGASGSYKVVRLLPSDGDDYQYRIKHAGEAFERVAKESQLELES
jgi:hypothetical protein